MKRASSRRVQWIGGILALAMTLVSLIANSVQTDQDKKKVARMTDRMKTVCVGRFLIDLPVEAKVSIHGGFVGGFDVANARESEDQFNRRLRSMEAQLVAARNELGRPSLESTKALSFESAQGKVLVYNRERAQGMAGARIIDIEVVKLYGALRFPGLSITANAEGQAPARGDALARLLGRLRPIGEGEIPKERGFCIGHSLVRDPYERPETESVVMFAGLPGHPDVNIVLSSMAGTAPATSLLARHAAAAERQPFYMRMAFTRLRERKRTINGLPGEELAQRVREPNFTTGFAFQWQMIGKEDDIYAPLLTLELESGTNPVNGGKPVQSTLTEEAMTELWERIVSSIRIRPAEEAKVVATAPVAAAIGTNALAGDVCPHTGWWQCGDGGDGVGVFGGQRQYLKAGQRMPQALLLPPQTLWQRLRGVQPSYESRSPTIWKLVDKRSSARLPQLPMLANPGAITENSSVPAGAVPYGLSEAPIGSVAKTGTACPSSGWWRCEDSHALDGTRWFAAGSLLPAATFRAPIPTRGSAHPEFIHRRSAWQLVRHASAGDERSGRRDDTSADDSANS